MKRVHERVSFERLLNNSALHTDPAAVDEPHLTKSRRMSFVDILFDDR